jgi:proteasome lid subunit RPN8/RPN11
MQIAIKKDVFYEMLMHCLQQSPLEAFGYLGGSTEKIEAMHKTPALKDDTSPPDPAEGFRMRREMKQRGHKLLGVFRAHARTDRPTQLDLDSMPDADAVLFIVALSEAGMAVAKAYELQRGAAVQITIEIE